MNKSRFRNWWILLWLGVFCATVSLVGRVRRENNSSPVEITVEWDDVTRCASSWGVSTEDLLKDLRKKGVRGVVIDMSTIHSLVEDGRLTLISREAAIPLYPDLQSVSKSYPFILVTNDGQLYGQLQEWMKIQPVEMRERSVIVPPEGSKGPFFIPVPYQAAGISQTPMGFDPEQIEMLRSAKLEPVTRLRNFNAISVHNIKKIFDSIKSGGGRIWIPQGQVLGYESLLPATARLMRQKQISLAFMEEDNPVGTGDLGRDSLGWIVRGHAAGIVETANSERGELVDRYLRAVRERNARLLVVRLRRQDQSASSHTARVQNLEFLGALSHAITSDPLAWRSLRPGLHIGLAKPNGIYGTSASKATAVRFTAGCAVFAAFMLLLNLVVDLTHSKHRGLVIAGFALTGILALFPGFGAKILALIGAIVFPTIAIAWSGIERRPTSATRREAFQQGFAVLCRATAVSLAGGLVIAALFGNWKFHVYVDSFAGTKAASMLPLALVAGLLAGEFWPKRIDEEGAQAGWDCLKRRFQSWSGMAFPLRSILLTVFTGLVIAIWLARSGNDSGVGVSTFEWKFRAWLENHLIARPRTKEFLLCNPALMVGAVAWLARRKYLGVGLILLGLIGQTSIVNSFSQANNPLYLPFWRTVLSLGLGGVVGYFLIYPLAFPWGFRKDNQPWKGWKLTGQIALGATALLAISWGWSNWNQRRAYAVLVAPVHNANWPWPGAKHEILTKGVEHWFVESTPDGTTYDLLSFDFAANPNLHLGFLDSDLATKPKGSTPPNRFAYWNNGLGKMARRLNENGDLVAAWNGSFWGLLNRKPREADRSFHLSPIVSDGRVYYSGLNRRWTWGAKMKDGRPVFSLHHAPAEPILKRDFDFATGTLQALVVNKNPLQIQPYPWFGAAPLPGGLPSTAEQAGTISVLDDMHTSRAGIGWTASGRLFVLVVKEPDGESPSRAAVSKRVRGSGGWTIRDHQAFWLSMVKGFGVENAVGLDGGDVAQAVYRRTDGDYTMLVPRIAIPEHEKATLRLRSDGKFVSKEVQDLKGGALNYFYIREKSPQH